MFRCAVCEKAFTEQIFYDQHMKSNEHKIKVSKLAFSATLSGASANLTDGVAAAKSKSNELLCIDCNLSFDSIKKLVNHQLTQEHALNVKQGNQTCNVSNSDSMENVAFSTKDEILPGFGNVSTDQGQSFISCSACKENFTGPELYQQHLNGDLHKKNAELKKNTAEVNLNSMLFCETCKITCTGQIPYMQHINSEAHRKKLRQLQVLQDYSNGMDSSPRLEKSDVSLNSILVCETCNITCTGQIPYMQHMNSEAHRKKLRQLQVVQEYSNAMNSSPRLEESNVGLNSILACKTCNITCTGQIPYMQHMNSEAHRKKLRQIHGVQNYANETDSSSMVEESRATASSSTNPWYCTSCHKQCNGDIPYKQHLSGASHLKNVRKYEQNTPGNYGNTFQSVVSNSERGDEKFENSILPSFVNGLEIVSTEILEKSVKIFAVDEKIDFDKHTEINTELTSENVKCNNSKENKSEIKNESILKQDEIDKAFGNIQVEISHISSDKLDSNEKRIYRICETCNVMMYSEEDVVKHYDSLEHARKKWGFQRSE